MHAADMKRYLFTGMTEICILIVTGVQWRTRDTWVDVLTPVASTALAILSLVLVPKMLKAWLGGDVYDEKRLLKKLRDEAEIQTDTLTKRTAEAETKLTKRTAEAETKLTKRTAEAETKLTKRTAEAETELTEQIASRTAELNAKIDGQNDLLGVTVSGLLADLHGPAATRPEDGPDYMSHDVFRTCIERAVDDLLRDAVADPRRFLALLDRPGAGTRLNAVRARGLRVMWAGAYDVHALPLLLRNTSDPTLRGALLSRDWTGLSPGDVRALWRADCADPEDVRNVHRIVAAQPAHVVREADEGMAR